MSKNKGLILLASLVLIFCLSTILLALAQQLIGMKKLFFLEEKKLSTYYLAQAGLHHGRFLAQDPAWSTEESAPPATQIGSWLLTTPAQGGSKGYYGSLPNGGYKIVKIAGQTELYSIGFIGNSLEKAVYKIILREENNKWEII